MNGLTPSGIVRSMGFQSVLENQHGLEAHATAHDVISLYGNIGQEFLIRDDGVYIGELFTDQRMAPATLPPDENIIGLPINDSSLGGEPFNGWSGRQRDGKVRMTYGYTDVCIAEVVGLDRRPLPPARPRQSTVRLRVPRLQVPVPTCRRCPDRPPRTPSQHDRLPAGGLFPVVNTGSQHSICRTLIADLGLLFSDNTGTSTVQRVHWIDPETNVVNDTPTEAEFNPSRWGTWLLK